MMILQPLLVQYQARRESLGGGNMMEIQSMEELD